ncbi:hypothetical protein B0H14DRAFT_2807485 [Mycena olivaceomarginata]|nr:hypothetical protein B0H14DRAFT_2807485 [Mycena olivaceomarginata]
MRWRSRTCCSSSQTFVETMVSSLHSMPFIEAGNILSLASPCFHGDPALGLVMQRITLRIAITLLSTLVHLAAGISLLNPTTDVTLGTSVDCQWNAIPADPATFSLVMQFSNGSADFGDHAVSNTTGMVNDIKNVIHLGPHRLAAYGNPFDPTTEPFAVSPAFQVVVNSMYAFAAITFLVSASTSNSAAPPLSTKAPAPTTLTPSSSSSPHSNSNPPTEGATPTSTPTSSSSSPIASPQSNKDHTPLVVSVTIGCVVLALGFLGTAFLMWRHRKAQTLDLLRSQPFPPLPLDPQRAVHRAVFTAPSPSSADGGRSSAVVAQRLEKAESELEDLRAEMRGLRLGQEPLPPSYSDLNGLYIV